MPSRRKASTWRGDPQFFPSYMTEKALAAAASLSPSCCECPLSRGGGGREGAARGAWCRWACPVARRPANVAVCIVGAHDGLVGPRAPSGSGTVAARTRHGMGDY